MDKRSSELKYNPQTNKFATGRTTKYVPEICQEIIDYCSQGNSLKAFCVMKKMTRQTLLNWAELYEDLASALDIAKDSYSVWYENQLNKQITGEVKSSPQANIFALKAFCGYRDSDAPQTNIQVNYDSLPEEQKLKVLQEALKQIEAKECAVETTDTSSNS